MNAAGQSSSPGALSPQVQSQEIKTIKDLIAFDVTLCNEKVKNYYLYRTFEPGELKNELLEFFDNFADLFFNSSELLLAKKQGKNDYAEIEKHCQLIDSWIKMEHYDGETSVYDIYDDGVNLFKKYLTYLARTELYQVM